MSGPWIINKKIFSNLSIFPCAIESHFVSYCNRGFVETVIIRPQRVDREPDLAHDKHQDERISIEDILEEGSIYSQNLELIGFAQQLQNKKNPAPPNSAEYQACMLLLNLSKDSCNQTPQENLHD